MGYFIFESAVSTFETGPEFPQVQKMAPSYDYKAKNSVHALSRSVYTFPSFEPNLDYFIVHPRSKLTSLLSTAIIYGGFLINEEFKNIFNRFNLPPHKFYSGRVQFRSKFYQYFWFHIICDLTNYVDYTNSTFFIYLDYSHNLGNIDISSKEDYDKKKLKVKADNQGKTITIWADKIQLKNNFDKSLDLFTIGSYDSNFYISERLITEINLQNVTGFTATKAENLFL